MLEQLKKSLRFFTVYSGIPTIINAMQEYGLPAPKFESDAGVFRVTLYNTIKANESIDSDQKEILRFCKTPRSRSEIEQLFSGRMTIAYVMDKNIKPMVNEGLLALTIPDKPKSKYQKYYAVVHQNKSHPVVCN